MEQMEGCKKQVQVPWRDRLSIWGHSMSYDMQNGTYVQFRGSTMQRPVLWESSSHIQCPDFYKQRPTTWKVKNTANGFPSLMRSVPWRSWGLNLQPRNHIWKSTVASRAVKSKRRRKPSLLGRKGEYQAGPHWGLSLDAKALVTGKIIRDLTWGN